MIDPQRQKSSLIDWLVALGLFSLALWLRAVDLTHFVTADEHNWIYRSGLFLNAFLRRDWPATSVWLTPAVTTTWLGSGSLAVYYQLHQAMIDQPFTEWLVSFSRNKIDLDILVIMRWSMAVFTAVMVAVVYGLARKLWPRPVALLGCVFLLTEPHLLSVSRIIGHDALVTVLMIASLLSFLWVLRRSSTANHPTTERPQKPLRFMTNSYIWLAFSGALAGLGVLSKAPAMFLIPFVGLLAVADLWQQRDKVTFWMLGLLIWGGALWLTFVLGWPAAWVAPLGKTWDVISNAFLSSAGLEDADIQPFVSIPQLGYFYYLINGLFKLSPLLTIGLIMALFGGWGKLRSQNHSLKALTQGEYFWLLLFAVLFGIFMSFGVKKSPRYILPAFPALAFVGAWGWLYLLRRLNRTFVVLGLSTAALLITLLYAPYYFTYYNPLLGGSITAPHLVRIGWGEGLDQVGRWLDAQPEAYADHAGVRYTATVYPFYQGNLSSPISEELDYVVFYIKQSQSGYPAPEILDYFEDQGALHQVVLNGLEYAQIYKGPAMEPVKANSSPDLPLAYRPQQIYAPIGESFSVDLLWPEQSAAKLAQQQATLSLASADSMASFASEAAVTRRDSKIWVSSHSFQLPPDFPRGTYSLLVNQIRIGTVKARQMDLPAGFEPLSYVMANLRLAGIKKQLTPTDLAIQLAWQAWPAATNDYTVFVQLLDQNNQRVAGIDVLPERGFTTLDRKETMVTSYLVPLPEKLEAKSYTLLVGLYYFVGDEIITVGAIPLRESIIIAEQPENP